MEKTLLYVQYLLLIFHSAEYCEKSLNDLAENVRKRIVGKIREFFKSQPDSEVPKLGWVLKGKGGNCLVGCGIHLILTPASYILSITFADWFIFLYFML
jgi:hypothetical protein